MRQQTHLLIVGTLGAIAVGCSSTPEAQPPAARTSFGDGTYIVGKDIQPGTYRTAGPVAADQLCSATVNYGREVGPSHTISRQIYNNGDPRGTFVVTIDAADQSFETSACAPWIKEQ